MKENASKPDFINRVCSATSKLAGTVLRSMGSFAVDSRSLAKVKLPKKLH